MKENYVHVYKTMSEHYPKNSPYNADIAYPEYKFGSNHIDKENSLYSEIRNLFYLMELDKENFNKPSWNPFNEFIKEGDTVLIKPNMVMHYNKNMYDNIDCLITHGSIIRVVVDYTYIALKGKGRIVIADAPVQSCDIEIVKDINGINEIIKLYNSLDFKVEVVDFRQERASTLNGNIIEIEKLHGDPAGYTVIDLKDKSAFKDKENNTNNLRITNYDYKVMAENQGFQKHRYLVPNTLLNADVIINLPKPKTHRKAGMTAAMKNFIGISGNKAWLPHHTKGSKAEGGDEYLNRNFIKNLSTNMQEKIDILSINEKVSSVKFHKIIRKILRAILKLYQKDIYSEGSWWGNDTIWRTIVDLNNIVMCADRNGEITHEQQRKVFSLLDAIIAGEGEGPLLPTSKICSLLVAGFNQLSIDTVMATLMGFNINRIPSVNNSYKINNFILNKFKAEDIIISSNVEQWDGKITRISSDNTLKFKPTAGWAGYIENYLKQT